MVVTKEQSVVDVASVDRLELYRMIGEGYKAIQDGRVSTIDEVRNKLNKKREVCG